MSYEIETHSGVSKKFLPKKKIVALIENLLKSEKIEKARVSVIFVDAEEILRLNREYLRHDYETDVIAFSYGESRIDGEIYVCVDVAQRQAQERNISLTSELKRLAAHGTLHLAGYDDATDEQKAEMTALEDKYIK